MAVKVEKMPDGRYRIESGGVYLWLTEAQADSLWLELDYLVGWEDQDL